MYNYNPGKHEVDRVWKNTKTYKTSDSEVATLWDIFDGLIKSGYKYCKWQLSSERHSAEFLAIDRKKAGRH